MEKNEMRNAGYDARMLEKRRLAGLVAGAGGNPNHGKDGRFTSGQGGGRVLKSLFHRPSAPPSTGDASAASDAAKAAETLPPTGPSHAAGFTPKESGMSFGDYVKTVSLDTGNGTPPSRKIQADFGFGNDDVKKAVETAGNIMNSVIAVPKDMPVSKYVDDKLEPSLNGFYNTLSHQITINNRANKGGLLKDIVNVGSTPGGDINGMSGDLNLVKYETAIHEFGHHIQNSVKLDMGEWDKAVAGSRRIGEIAALGKGANKDLKGYVDYLLMPQEIFARSFLQYVDEKQNRQLEDWGGTAERSFASPPEHLWEKADFAPIFESMDRMFTKAHMTRFSTKTRDANGEMI